MNVIICFTLTHFHIDIPKWDYEFPIFNFFSMRTRERKFWVLIVIGDGISMFKITFSVISLVIGGLKSDSIIGHGEF